MEDAVEDTAQVGTEDAREEVVNEETADQGEEEYIDHLVDAEYGEPDQNPENDGLPAVDLNL